MASRRPRRAAALLGAIAVLAAALVAPRTGVAEAASQDPVRTAERRGGCTGRVALTFDDGPATPTRRAVRLLREARVPATFFMVGQRVAGAPVLTRSVERAGFLVANHSWAHVDMTTQTAAQVEQTLRTTQRALRRAGTHPTRLMRPPYGALDAVARQGIRAAGMVPILWTIDSRDWESGTSSDIAARIVSRLRPGDNIVLQHDGVARSAISVEAIPAVVRGARRRGYCFTALDEGGRPGFPTPRVSVAVTDAAEGEAATAVVRLSKPAGRATSVRLRTRSRSAQVGEDVRRVVTRVTVPAGRLSARVRIPVRRDGLDEAVEEFGLRISLPRGLRLGDDRAVARILDQDAPPRILGVDTAVPEPATDQASVPVEFRLSGPSGRTIRVVLRTFAGTADGSDFVVTREELVLPAGRVSVTFAATVLPDDLEEPEETFRVAVVRASAVRVGRAATVAITPPAPSEP